MTQRSDTPPSAGSADASSEKDVRTETGTNTPPGERSGAESVRSSANQEGERDDIEYVREALTRWVYDSQNKSDPEVQANLRALNRIARTIEQQQARIEGAHKVLDLHGAPRTTWSPYGGEVTLSLAGRIAALNPGIAEGSTKGEDE